MGAEKAKDRIEKNQDMRWKAAKESKKEEGIEFEDPELYQPRFFTRHCRLDADGKKRFSYTPIENKYWE